MRTLETTGIFLGLTLAAAGCATKGFVQEQLAPLEQRLSSVESGLRGTQSDVARALGAMQNLRLEHKLVLDLKDGANFASGSSSMTKAAQQEVDRFLNELDERDRASAGWTSRYFVVAGHTDAMGSEDSNYALGQRRAEKVTGYLVGQKGISPLKVSTVSYGESTPVASNSSRDGRRRNRRVEIHVYNEGVNAR